MTTITAEFLEQQIELADCLRAGRSTMLEPQDLPGRFGRVIRALDRVLGPLACEAGLAGGWAVWRYGFAARVTQDVDVALPASRIDEFMKVASLTGFEILPQQQGRWPKLRHKDTGMQVDILPEGARPGTATNLAPTSIPSPGAMGVTGYKVSYIRLESLIELKIAAGREKDLADVVALVKTNPDRIDSIRQHLSGVHPHYVDVFEQRVQSAREQAEN
jgi:hypothetical protein